MSYPENSIKGIPNDDFLIKDHGTVGAHLFYFEQIRRDGARMQSINWEDRESVIDFTLNQKKENGELQFKAGVAIVPRFEIDRLNQRPTIKGLLSYERETLDDNPYHGNLLLQANVPNPIRKMIAAGLALVVSGIIPQRQNSSGENEG